MARLEPLFEIAHLTSDLDSAPVMAVVDEYPCRDIRGGGLFNAGTYFVRRHPLVSSILTAWHQSEFYGGAGSPDWPARQGAFSHDPHVYAAHSRRITAFPAGCVAGSPFAPLIGHALGGTINGVFDPNDARVEVEREVHQCVMGSLLDRQARTCALKQKIFKQGLLLDAH